MATQQPELREWLRAIMKQRGLSHRQLAAMCDLSKSTITKIVGYTYMHEATPDTCRSLARGLNVPEHEVLQVAGWLSEIDTRYTDLRLIQHVYDLLDEPGRKALVQHAEALRRDLES